MLYLCRWRAIYYSVIYCTAICRVSTELVLYSAKWWNISLFEKICLILQEVYIFYATCLGGNTFRYHHVLFRGAGLKRKCHHGCHYWNTYSSWCRYPETGSQNPLHIDGLAQDCMDILLHSLHDNNRFVTLSDFQALCVGSRRLSGPGDTNEKRMCLPSITKPTMSPTGYIVILCSGCRPVHFFIGWYIWLFSIIFSKSYKYIQYSIIFHNDDNQYVA